MNTDKNSYTIIYATVMSVVAAVLLAGASVLLSEQQAENKRIDKMEQILRAIGQKADQKSQVAQLYAQSIKESAVLDASGQVKESYTGDQLASSKDRVFNKALEAGEYPLYKAEVDGKPYYIIPLNGAGLWGPIWGYIAVDAQDGSTVLGIDLGNQGETPGLGAEMSTEPFMSLFKGKQLFDGETFRGIAIIKPGSAQITVHNVDGLSGGTITSNGIHDMLDKCLTPYQAYLKANKS